MKKRFLALALAFLLAAGAAGCSPSPAAHMPEYVLYFTVNSDGTDPSAAHGSALCWEAYDAAQCTADHPEGESCPSPGDLLEALLAGPTQEGLTSPFPSGVSLRSWSWDESQPGQLNVNLSEQYSGLTDISLTLADYCIVLTLSQLEGVETVEIASGGRAISYRSHQILSEEEAELPGSGAEGADAT